VADSLAEPGKQFGPNTGRRRRPGWLDAVMIRHAVGLNFLDEAATTKQRVARLCRSAGGETGIGRRIGIGGALT
jgi:adenylosuccinate synthase